jgi:3-methyladenine DNA glycosylase AlkD
MTPERNSPRPEATAELILRELHAYALAQDRLGEQEDLMHKALGWLLREAGKTDSRRLQAFLLRHGPSLPRTSLRYAIERFPENERQRLLKATRS